MGPSLTLTGTKQDGSIVSGDGTTKTLENYIGPNFIEPQFSAIDLILPPEVEALFKDLVSLKIEISNGFVDETTSLAEYGADIFLLGIEECGGYKSCMVPGLGEFNFSGYIAGRNDYRNVRISEIQLSFSETPAPVPLPASALLLLAGLGTLSVASRKRL